MVKTEQHVPIEPVGRADELETLFAANNGSASVPLDRQGKPVVPLLEQFVATNYGSADWLSRRRIADAALAAHAISTGNPDAAARYNPFAPDPGELPDLSGFSFVPEWTRLPKRSALTLAAALPEGQPTVRDAACFILGGQIESVEKALADGATYTPIFTDTADPDAQLQRPEAIAAHLAGLKRLQTVIAETDEAAFAAGVGRGVIVNPLTRFHQLPSAVPAMAKGDFDSGYCDRLSLSAASPGEPVYLLAQLGGWRLALTDRRYGWIAAKDVAQIGEKERLPDYLYYTGSTPYFGADAQGNRFVLLPGDPVTVSPDGSLGRLRRSADGRLNTTPIALPDPNLVQPAPQTPQQFLARMYAGGPYMHAVHDCSAHILAVWSQMGYLLPRYSGDLAQVLEQSGIHPSTVTTAPGMDALADGLYLTEFRQPVKGGEGFRSIHLSVTTIKGEIFQSASCAFGLYRDDGSTNYPVGFDISSKKALGQQLLHSRQLRFFPLARKKG